MALRTAAAIFGQQPLMTTLGARLATAEPGHVRIEMPVTAAIGQQHGYVHAGALTSIVDTACGCAAATAAEPGTEVLSIGYTVSLMSPARGHTIVADGRVVSAGRTIGFCEGTVTALGDDGEVVCARMLATMRLRPPRPAE